MEKVIIVGLNLKDGTDFERSMEELKALAEACDMLVVGRVDQAMSMVNKAFYIGTGKVLEVEELAEETEAELIIFDNSLSPSQLRNLQNDLKLPVMDRTTLILEIFSSRAKTREAKLQVEVARLQYMLPRLVGMREALSRQGGGSGSLSNKGAGEKKLELDRRKIENQLAKYRRELAEVEQGRLTQRKRRNQSGEFKVALVGYTNAGKSTILNKMIEQYVQEEDKKVLEKDMLFATLETTVRRIVTEDKRSFLISDTVGFISSLPHNLIKAFRSTLEEAGNADLLLLVVDYSDPYYKEQMQITRETLEDLEIFDIPILIVYNKADLKDEISFSIPKETENSIFICAKEKEHIKVLVEKIYDYMQKDYVKCEMLIPFERGQVVTYLKEHALIQEMAYEEEGTRLKLSVRKEDYGRYKNFCVY